MVRRFLQLLGLLTIFLLSSLPAGAQQAAPGADAKPLTHPSILLNQAIIDELRGYVAGLSPNWTTLWIWAQENARQAAVTQDGPGMALTSRLLASNNNDFSRRLGVVAVRCALNGARFGKVEKATVQTILDPDRPWEQRELLDSGYILLATASGDHVMQINHYNASKVVTPLESGTLQDIFKPGDTYYLLIKDLPTAALVVEQVALTLDWGWDHFTSDERKNVANWLMLQASVFSSHPAGCFDSDSAAVLKLSLLAALASRGLHPDAEKLLETCMQDRIMKGFLPALEHAGDGGAWFEGDNLGARAGLDLLMSFAALPVGPVRNRCLRCAWSSDRLGYLNMHLLPGVAKSPAGAYSPISPCGGDQRLEPRMAADLVRLQMTLLSRLYPDSPQSAWALSILLDDDPGKVTQPHLYGYEMLWMSPRAMTSPLATAPLAMLSRGVGRVISRSGWTSLSTWLAFEAGPWFTEAQHLNAGGLVLYSRGMLLPAGGGYDGAHTAHALNYAMRSVAQNTVLIRDPKEDSWPMLRGQEGGARGFANDGGQRAPCVFAPNGRPEKCPPATATGWDSGDAPWTANSQAYQMASITAMDNQYRYCYMSGDLTKAYDGSTHKAKRLVRHVVHLRPGGPDDPLSREVVAVIDDMELAAPGLESDFVLHLAGKPEMDGDMKSDGAGRWTGKASSLRYTQGGTGLTVKCLSPGDNIMRLYGQEGKADSWCDGRNYPPEAPAVNPAPWRVEIEPAVGGAKRTLVHVLLPGPVEDSGAERVTRLETDSDQLVGILIKDRLWPRVLVVNLGEPKADTEISYPCPEGETRHLVCGLVPGAKYDVLVSRGKVRLSPGSALTSSPSGVLAFKVAPPKAEKENRKEK